MSTVHAGAVCTRTQDPAKWEYHAIFELNKDVYTRSDAGRRPNSHRWSARSWGAGLPSFSDARHRAGQLRQPFRRRSAAETAARKGATNTKNRATCLAGSSTATRQAGCSAIARSSRCSSTLCLPERRRNSRLPFPGVLSRLGVGILDKLDFAGSSDTPPPDTL